MSIAALAEAGLISGRLLGAQRLDQVVDEEAHPLLVAPVESGVADQLFGGLPAGEVGLHEPAQQRVLRPGLVGESAVALGRTERRRADRDPAEPRRRASRPGAASRRGRRARPTASFAVDRSGANRRTGPSAASTSSASSGAAWSARSAAWSGLSAVVMMRSRPPGDLPGRRHLDLALEDLAGRPLGQRRRRTTRGAGTCTPPPGPSRSSRSSSARDRRTGLQHDRRADLLAERRMRHADHGGLGHVRVLVQHLLDLARVDVVAAADDQVLLAVDDEVVAVLVAPGPCRRCGTSRRRRSTSAVASGLSQ